MASIDKIIIFVWSKYKKGNANTANQSRAKMAWDGDKGLGIQGNPNKMRKGKPRAYWAATPEF